MEVKLKSAHAESFARIASLVQGLKEAGIRGFVPARADTHDLHVGLRVAGQLEDRFAGEPIVDVDALVKLHPLLRQLHRAVADGILDPCAVPIRLLEALSIVEEHIQDAGYAGQLDVPLSTRTDRPVSPAPTQWGPGPSRRRRSG